MNFADVKSLAIPEGEAAVICCNDEILWQKNLFDGEVIRGHVDATNGTVYTTSSMQKTAMSKNPIPVFGGAVITVSNDKNYYCYIVEYDANQKFIRTQKTPQHRITVRLHPNTRYIRVRSDYTQTQNDLSVNYTFVVYVPRELPPEYQAVAYLKSDGTAYIDTEISGSTEGLAIDINFAYEKFVAYGAVYGNYVSDNHDGTRLICSTSENDLISNMNNICTTSGNTVVTAVPAGTVLGFVIQFNRATDFYDLNGVRNENVSTVKGTANDGNIALFNRSLTNPNTQRNIGLMVKDCLMTVHGIPVRDYMPCYIKSSGEGGLYDFVSGRFFGSVGPGEFSYVV